MAETRPPNIEQRSRAQLIYRAVEIFFQQQEKASQQTLEDNGFSEAHAEQVINVLVDIGLLGPYNEEDQEYARRVDSHDAAIAEVQDGGIMEDGRVVEKPLAERKMGQIIRALEGDVSLQQIAEMLGGKDEDVNTLRSAYRKIATKIHYDVVTSLNDPDLEARAQEAFKNLDTKWKILKKMKEEGADWTTKEGIVAYFDQLAASEAGISRNDRRPFSFRQRFAEGDKQNQPEFGVFEKKTEDGNRLKFAFESNRFVTRDLRKKEHVDAVLAELVSQPDPQRPLEIPDDFAGIPAAAAAAMKGGPAEGSVDEVFKRATAGGRSGAEKKNPEDGGESVEMQQGREACQKLTDVLNALAGKEVELILVTAKPARGSKSAKDAVISKRILAADLREPDRRRRWPAVEIRFEKPDGDTDRHSFSYIPSKPYSIRLIDNLTLAAERAAASLGPDAGGETDAERELQERVALLHQVRSRFEQVRTGKFLTAGNREILRVYPVHGDGNHMYFNVDYKDHNTGEIKKDQALALDELSKDDLEQLKAELDTALSEKNTAPEEAPTRPPETPAEREAREKAEKKQFIEDIASAVRLLRERSILTTEGELIRVFESESRADGGASVRVEWTHIASGTDGRDVFDLDTNLSKLQAAKAKFEQSLTDNNVYTPPLTAEQQRAQIEKERRVARVKKLLEGAIPKKGKKGKDKRPKFVFNHASEGPCIVKNVEEHLIAGEIVLFVDLEKLDGSPLADDFVIQTEDDFRDAQSYLERYTPSEPESPPPAEPPVDGVEQARKERRYARVKSLLENAVPSTAAESPTTVFRHPEEGLCIVRKVEEHDSGAEKALFVDLENMETGQLLEDDFVIQGDDDLRDAQRRLERYVVPEETHETEPETIQEEQIEVLRQAADSGIVFSFGEGDVAVDVAIVSVGALTYDEQHVEIQLRGLDADGNPADLPVRDFSAAEVAALVVGIQAAESQPEPEEDAPVDEPPAVPEVSAAELEVLKRNMDRRKELFEEASEALKKAKSQVGKRRFIFGKKRTSADVKPFQKRYNDAWVAYQEAKAQYEEGLEGHNAEQFAKHKFEEARDSMFAAQRHAHENPNDDAAQAAYEAAKREYERARAEYAGAAVTDAMTRLIQEGNAKVQEELQKRGKDWIGKVSEKGEQFWKKIRKAYSWLGEQNLNKFGDEETKKQRGRFNKFLRGTLSVRTAINTSLIIGSSLISGGGFAVLIGALAAGRFIGGSGLTYDVLKNEYLSLEETKGLLKPLTEEEVQEKNAGAYAVSDQELAERVGLIMSRAVMDGKRIEDSKYFDQFVLLTQEITRREQEASAEPAPAENEEEGENAETAEATARAVDQYMAEQLAKTQLQFEDKLKQQKGKKRRHIAFGVVVGSVLASGLAGNAIRNVADWLGFGGKAGAVAEKQKPVEATQEPEPAPEPEPTPEPVEPPVEAVAEAVPTTPRVMEYASANIEKGQGVLNGLNSLKEASANTAGFSEVEKEAWDAFKNMSDKEFRAWKLAQLDEMGFEWKGGKLGYPMTVHEGAEVKLYYGQDGQWHARFADNGKVTVHDSLYFKSREIVKPEIVETLIKEKADVQAFENMINTQTVDTTESLGGPTEVVPEQSITTDVQVGDGHIDQFMDKLQVGPGMLGQIESAEQVYSGHGVRVTIEDGRFMDVSPRLVAGAGESASTYWELRPMSESELFQFLENDDFDESAQVVQKTFKSSGDAVSNKSEIFNTRFETLASAGTVSESAVTESGGGVVETAATEAPATAEQSLPPPEAAILPQEDQLNRASEFVENAELASIYKDQLSIAAEKLKTQIDTIQPSSGLDQLVSGIAAKFAHEVAMARQGELPADLLGVLADNPDVAQSYLFDHLTTEENLVFADVTTGSTTMEGATNVLLDTGSIGIAAKVSIDGGGTHIFVLHENDGIFKQGPSGELMIEKDGVMNKAILEKDASGNMVLGTESASEEPAIAKAA